MHFIQTNNEEKNLENKDYIEDLKEKPVQGEGCFIVFDKKDVTLKIDIDEVKIKMSEQEYYSKVDAKINDEIKSEDIIKMLKHIPKHLELRLEVDCIEQIIKLMKNETLIENLKEQVTKFVYKGIEIETRIIVRKMDGDDLKEEIEAKRLRINMDSDK